MRDIILNILCYCTYVSKNALIVYFLKTEFISKIQIFRIKQNDIRFSLKYEKTHTVA